MSLIFLALGIFILALAIGSFKSGRLWMRSGHYIDRKVTPPHYWIFLGWYLLLGAFIVCASVNDALHWLPGLCANLWKFAVCAITRNCQLTYSLEPVDPTP